MVKLNMDNLHKRIMRTISTEEALKKTTSIEWPNEVVYAVPFLSLSA